MTMMATPNINKELHYLNKEDRLLRWLLVEHRDSVNWLDSKDSQGSKRQLKRSTLLGNYNDADMDDDDDDDDEYEPEKKDF